MAWKYKKGCRRWWSRIVSNWKINNLRVIKTKSHPRSKGFEDEPSNELNSHHPLILILNPQPAHCSQSQWRWSIPTSTQSKPHFNRSQVWQTNPSSPQLSWFDSHFFISLSTSRSSSHQLQTLSTLNISHSSISFQIIDQNFKPSNLSQLQSHSTSSTWSLYWSTFHYLCHCLSSSTLCPCLWFSTHPSIYSSKPLRLISLSSQTSSTHQPVRSSTSSYPSSRHHSQCQSHHLLLNQPSCLNLQSNHSYLPISLNSFEIGKWISSSFKRHTLLVLTLMILLALEVSSVFKESQSLPFLQTCSVWRSPQKFSSLTSLSILVNRWLPLTSKPALNTQTLHFSGPSSRNWIVIFWSLSANVVRLALLTSVV